MTTRVLSTLFMLLHLLVVPGFTAEKAKSANEKRVRDYVAAYNKKDLDSMLKMVSDDIQWLYIMGEKIVVEAKGKEKLRKSLAAYFKSAPKVRSDLEWTRSTSSRVTALERASWPSKTGRKSQASLSVYEFKRGKISRVYYFPSEK